MLKEIIRKEARESVCRKIEELLDCEGVPYSLVIGFAALRCSRKAIAGEEPYACPRYDLIVIPPQLSLTYDRRLLTREEGTILDQLQSSPAAIEKATFADEYSHILHPRLCNESTCSLDLLPGKINVRLRAGEDGVTVSYRLRNEATSPLLKIAPLIEVSKSLLERILLKWRGDAVGNFAWYEFAKEGVENPEALKEMVVNYYVRKFLVSTGNLSRILQGEISNDAFSCCSTQLLNSVGYAYGAIALQLDEKMMRRLARIGRKLSPLDAIILEEMRFRIAMAAGELMELLSS